MGCTGKDIWEAVGALRRAVVRSPLQPRTIKLVGFALAALKLGHLLNCSHAASNSSSYRAWVYAYV